MRNIFLFVISCTFLIHSCSDGDVITVALDFEDTFQECNSNGDALFFKTKDTPSESLSILIDDFNTDILFADKKDTIITRENIDFTYRTYSNEKLPSNIFCNIISPAELAITSENVSKCDADFTIILVLDDEDGIPTENESKNGMNPIGDEDEDGVPNYLDDDSNNKDIGDENNAVESDYDTDNDGLADFIDVDDDGDNVLTKDEIDQNQVDSNNTILPLTEQDTDGDGIPNYLDNDDDGDNIPTINEDLNGDLNPGNDIETGATDTTPFYLNDKEQNSEVIDQYREHTYSENYTVRLNLRDVDLEFLSQDVLFFGELTGNSKLKQTRDDITPDFP